MHLWYVIVYDLLRRYVLLCGAAGELQEGMAPLDALRWLFEGLGDLPRGYGQADGDLEVPFKAFKRAISGKEGGRLA